eukprot:TRINITY_DN5246_c0_g1_i2.p1 TRINITY_DN5246_c0_g1~~TRINITY_DN5246_c0_g1_i2.p1  ORF type:complete len:109 (-),score=2.75 TRINITY_DN5246_c0_g1_i2:20-346(-)
MVSSKKGSIITVSMQGVLSGEPGATRRENNRHPKPDSPTTQHSLTGAATSQTYGATDDANKLTTDRVARFRKQGGHTPSETPIHLHGHDVSSSRHVVEFQQHRYGSFL